jgi:hypothetical protein
MKFSTTFAVLAVFVAAASAAPTPFSDDVFEVDARGRGDGYDHPKPVGPPKPKPGRRSFSVSVSQGLPADLC